MDNLKEVREKLLDKLTMIPLDLELEEGRFIKKTTPLIIQYEAEVLKNAKCPHCKKPLDTEK